MGRSAALLPQRPRWPRTPTEVFPGISCLGMKYFAHPDDCARCKNTLVEMLSRVEPDGHTIGTRRCPHLVPVDLNAQQMHPVPNAVGLTKGIRRWKTFLLPKKGERPAFEARRENPARGVMAFTC